MIETGLIVILYEVCMSTLINCPFGSFSGAFG